MPCTGKPFKLRIPHLNNIIICMAERWVGASKHSRFDSFNLKAVGAFTTPIIVTFGADDSTLIIYPNIVSNIYGRSAYIAVIFYFADELVHE
jgi:hypothetical protein